MLTSSDCASDWERGRISSWTDLFGIVSGGTIRSVPAGNVCCACPACQVRSTSRVTVSSHCPGDNLSPRCQEWMTSTLVQVGPSHRSNQSSAIPSNPPIWKVHACRPPAKLRQTIPTRSPAIFAINPSLGQRRDRFELRLREHRLHPSNGELPRTVCAAQTSGSDPFAVKRSPGRDLCAISPSGFVASFSHHGNRPDSLDARSSCSVQSSLTWVQYLLDMKSVHAWRVPHPWHPVFY